MIGVITSIDKRSQIKTKNAPSKIPANNIADYYGDYVVNYTKGGTYQLYYVDNEGYFGDTGRIYGGNGQQPELL